MNIQEHENWFDGYATQKIAGAAVDREPLELKLLHSRKVLERARKIIAGENFEPETGRLALLGALYHDLGRFDQYLRYGTFKDKDSCNHGLLSEKILKQENRLADEPERAKHLIYTAVGLHNRAALPAGLSGEQRRICNVVRDADKLDILRVMDNHLSGGGPYNPTIVLSLPDRQDIFSSKLVEAVMQGKPVSYQDLLTVNDFRLLLGAWFYDMNFDSSREIFAREGHAGKVVEQIPDNEFYGLARRKVLEALAKFEGPKG